MHEQTHRILYLIGQLSVGGTEHQLLYLVQKIDRTRFAPQIVCLTGDVPLISFFEGLCPIHVLRHTNKSRFTALKILRALCAEIQPDLVHSFGYASRAAISGIIIPSQTRIIFAIRGLPRWQKWWDKWLELFSWRQSDLVLSNSQSALSAYCTALGSSHKRFRVIPNGLDLEKFDQIWLSDIAIIEDMGIEYRSPNVICVVARLCAEKRLDILIDAITSMVSVFPDFVLWIVGSGHLRHELTEQVCQLGLEEKVVFWGNRMDVPSLLRRAKVGVLSSQFESMPNALLEYMAASLPVVATDVGGNSEVVVHNETGLLVEPGDPNALAQALLTILKNPDLARRFGEAGRRRVESHFTLKQMVIETEDVYQSLLLNEA